MTSAHSNAAVYRTRDVVVEDFRIDINNEDSQPVARLRMRYGVGMWRYWLHARVRYSEDGSGSHEVTIRRLHDDEVIETLEMDWTTAEPNDEFSIVQGLHETYLQSPDDWYDLARSADQRGRQYLDGVRNFVSILSNDAGDFEYEVRVTATIDEYDVTIHAEHVEESIYSPGIDFSMRFFRDDVEEVFRTDRCWPADDFDGHLDFLDYVEKYARLEIRDGLQLARLYDDAYPAGEGQ